MMTNTSDNTNIGLGYSPDALAERKAELLNLLGQVAPELLSDNQLNLDKLKDLLAGDIADPQEHYELNWAGKAAARREVQKTTSSTLLPDPNNPAQAQHMLIEGENLEVLRVLQKSYYGKVKMIYIDPPYNTGNDSFVYPDDYSETLDEYLKRTGEKNEDGYLNKQSLWKKNSKESGQYHSAWLSMMYPRLYLARNLLRDDGVIFISIDDNEAANLKLLCDEVFGGENFIGSISWLKKRKGSFLSKKLVSVTEYLLIYGRTQRVKLFGGMADESESQPLVKRTNSIGQLTFPAGCVKTKLTDGLYQSGIYGDGSSAIELLNDISIHQGVIIDSFSLKGPFVWGQSYLESQIKAGARLVINTDSFQIRAFKAPDPDSHKGLLSFVDGVALGATNEDAYEQLRDILKIEGAMSYPKPVNYIKHIIKSVTYWDKNSVILDFFAGSGTTAHAVMELNAEDGGNRQSISVQLPELLDEKSEAYKAGYRTIADITRARIEKVIAKLKAEKPDQNQDLACAHFKLAPSNFKVWRSDLVDVDAVRNQLEIFQQAEKDSAINVQNGESNQQAMLTELLLKNGLGALGVHAISKPKLLANGMTIHRVLMNDDRLLWLCFDAYQQGFKDEVITANPAQVIMLNSCFNTVGEKADEYISNLQLELQHYGIGLLII